MVEIINKSPGKNRLYSKGFKNGVKMGIITAFLMFLVIMFILYYLGLRFFIFEGIFSIIIYLFH